MRDKDVSSALLIWYDRAARVMPWRVSPAERAGGVHPDPYHVWLSEVMLQQTTVAAVQDYFRSFTARWPDVAALAAARDADVMAEWAGLGYYARARNLLKCARIVVAEYDGSFPQSQDGLLSLPGIGPYTAAAIASIAFGEPATVVDSNVERVVARLFAVKTPLPAAKSELTALAARLTPLMRPGDHAQAMMDLGATICTPRNPVCGLCPIAGICRARTSGIEADLPRKLPKPEKPTRQGIAYVAVRQDGALLLEQRPARGLLGGMLGWPGTNWGEAAPETAPPIDADWRQVEAKVRHTFTHFHLVLSVQIAEVPAKSRPVRGQFKPHDLFRPGDLPTVMRKVFDVAQLALQSD